MAIKIFTENNPLQKKNHTNVMIDTRGANRPKLCDWISERCIGRYYLYTNCIKFEKSQDAVMFTLRWGNYK
jgi:hypothetical protein